MSLIALLSKSKNIILDFDGVIADSEEFQLAVWAEILAERNLPMTGLTINAIAGIPDRLAIERACPQLTPQIYEELKKEKVLRCEQRIPKVKPVPGIQSFIESISGTKDLFICSSSPASTVGGFVKAHFPRIVFKLTVGKGDYQKPKPHPEPYMKILERSGIDPNQTIAIEDSQVGVQSALAAGLKVIHLNRYGDSKTDVPTAFSAWELSNK